MNARMRVSTPIIRAKKSASCVQTSNIY